MISVTQDDLLLVKGETRYFQSLDVVLEHQHLIPTAHFVHLQKKEASEHTPRTKLRLNC